MSLKEKLSKISTRFRYDDDIAGLKDILLQDNVPIQCEIVRKNGDIYRAQIATIVFPQKEKCEIEFTFSWVCKLTDIRHKTGAGAQLFKKEYWSPTNDIPNNTERFSYKHYYLHKHRRVKIKGTGSNYYILNPDDPARLVLHEGEYVSYESTTGSYPDQVRDEENKQ